jgi:thiamine biosynthesis lipoprotein
MGTFFTFQIDDEASNSSAQAHVDVAMGILRDADERFSLYKPESEISQLARGEIDWSQASLVQREIRDKTQIWKDKTDGYFNSISPEGVYDPSGLVKTWAATNAAIFLEANGYRDFTLNAGGDVYLGPEVKSKLLNRVGLSNLKPIASAEAAVNLVLDLAGTPFHGVATSGSAERGEHIWRSGDQTDITFTQVSVAAKDLITADIWATAIISGGLEAFNAFTANVNPSDAVAIATGSDLSMRTSPGFANILASL